MEHGNFIKLEGGEEISRDLQVGKDMLNIQSHNWLKNFRESDKTKDEQWSPNDSIDKEDLFPSRDLECIVVSCADLTIRLFNAEIVKVCGLLEGVVKDIRDKGLEEGCPGHHVNDRLSIEIVATFARRCYFSASALEHGVELFRSNFTKIVFVIEI